MKTRPVSPLRCWCASVLIWAAGAALAQPTPWPGGASVAVTLSFDLDAETLWWDDPERMTGPVGPVSQGAYGPRVALPKILALLARRDAKVTFFVPSWVAGRYPEAIKSIAAGGHELGIHGVRHQSPRLLDPAEERKRLRASIAALEQIAGRRPVGYRAPAWDPSPVTLKLVAREGLLYSSNLMDADLPYLHEDPAGLVELPVSWVLDDAPHFWFDLESWDKTIAPAATVQALWREEFAAAYAERGYFGLTLHPQLIGRPARLRMLDEFIGWMRGHSGVWFATCEQVAAHVKQSRPR